MLSKGSKSSPNDMCSFTKNILIKLPLSWYLHFMVERNLATLNIHCKFFPSMNAFHSHWLRILKTTGEFPFFSTLDSSPIPYVSLGWKVSILSNYGTRGQGTTMEWGNVGLYDAASPLSAHEFASGTHYGGWSAPLRMVGKEWAQCLVHGTRPANVKHSPLQPWPVHWPLSTIFLSITRVLHLMPLWLYSQAAVIVEKGSVKLNPAEVLIVDNK